MAKRCDICGKGPLSGRSYIRKGKPKKKGGVGRHIARKNIRRFMPNLQSARVQVGKFVKKIRVCTQCIKKGRFVRAAAVPAPAAAA
jgi:large subunit ribosomal protein L28